MFKESPVLFKFMELLNLSFAVMPVVSVTKNLALRKPTKQSSTLKTFTSSKAVDGDKAYCLSTHSTSTTKSQHPWWQVDLQAVYEIKEVIMTTMRDYGCEL